MIKMGARFKLQ